MSALKLQFNLSVITLKESKRFVAYSPALDLSTSGKTFEEARRRFGEAAALFFEELEQNGTTGEVLGELGWSERKNQWEPPIVISQESETITVGAHT